MEKSRIIMERGYLTFAVDFELLSSAKVVLTINCEGRDSCAGLGAQMAVKHSRHNFDRIYYTSI